MEWIIYLISVIGGLKIFLLLAIITMGAIIFGTFVVLDCAHGEQKEEFKKDLHRRTRIFFPMIIFSALLITFIPDKKTMLLIAGIHYGTQIEGIGDLPPNMVKALNNVLEDYIGKENE